MRRPIKQSRTRPIDSGSARGDLIAHLEFARRRFAVELERRVSDKMGLLDHADQREGLGAHAERPRRRARMTSGQTTKPGTSPASWDPERCPPGRPPGRRGSRPPPRPAASSARRCRQARLIDLLLIAAIRRWAEQQPDAGPPSWLTALRDPLIGRVLALLHDRPGEPWTLEKLASEVHVSRATLARRFTDEVGEPPLAYLSRWRMQVAAQRLKHTADTVERIAREVGYTSEYAFNRAFSRHRGHPPGRYRRLAQAA